MPTTAGISRASATIAVWLPGPPISVTKPRTKRRSRLAVSLGVRLWASTSTGEVRWAMPSRRRPSRCRKQPLLDVEDIGGPLRQVGAFQPLEDLGVAPQRAADGILGRVVPVPDHVFQFAAEPRVLEHLQMGVEDGGVLLAQFLGDGVAMAGDLGRRRRDGLFQPFQLVVHGIARHEPPRDAKSLVVHDQRFADGDARRNGYSL